MTEKGKKEEIKKIVTFLAVDMFEGPIASEDMPRVEAIASDFEDFILGRDVCPNKIPA